MKPDLKATPPEGDDELLDELIAGYFEADLSEQQMTALNGRLRTNALGRQRFVAVAMTVQACAAAERMTREKVIEDELATLSVMGLKVETAQPRQFETDPSLAALISLQPRRPAAGPASGKIPRKLGALRLPEWIRRAPLRSLAAAVLVAVSAAALLWRQFRAPAHSSVATLTRAVDATWGAQPPEIGAHLPAQTTLSLASGYAELTFATGATVVVEGPAEFTLGSAGTMSLLSGKLSAMVPPPAHGFTVTTPTASVTDLGTEFGVAVETDDRTRVEVFVGTVYALGVSNSNGDTRPTTPAQILSAGQAAVVSSTAVTLDAAGSSRQRFVRSLAEDATVDLADLLSGGDGVTERRGTGVDQTTGSLTSRFAGPRPAKPGYHRVSGRPVIDGCFVPDGRKGPMAIDSNDDRFRFPATSGLTDYDIWAGGALPILPTTRAHISPRLAKLDYSQPGHDLIFMHANAGVTFDLNAIRRLHPGMQIASFRFTGGDSFDVKGLRSQVDLFVIVNGVSRLEQRRLMNTEGPVVGDVPIYATDRFLTLAVTEAGGDGINGDWVVFGDPKLEMTVH